MKKKMRAVLNLLLLLLSAVTLLVSAQEWNNYRSLPDKYKTHIDKTLLEANNHFKHFTHHVGFEKLLSDPIITGSNLYVNVLLKVTECKKDVKKGFGHRDECVTQKPKTPWIDCLVCKRKDNGEELIDCARRAAIKQRKETRDKCSNYLVGGGSLALQKSGVDEQEFGCLGCV